MISSWQAAPLVVARIVAGGLLVVALGCGGSPEAGVDAPSSEVPSVAQNPTPDQRKAAPLTLAAAVRPGGQVVETPQTKAAREALHILTTPGSEPAAWEAAQLKLIALGADAAPVLIEALQSSNDVERETAATVCALTDTVEAPLQAALATCLSDSSSFVRANAAAALVRFPEHQPRVMSTLTDLLADTNPQLRRMSATNLSAFGPEASSALPQLTAVLTDNDAEVVTPVIQLLGRIGPQAVDAVPQLQKIAFEQHGELKHAAEQALLLIQTDAESRSPGEK